MTISGVVHGHRIDPDSPRRGSPEAVLKLVGTLTPDEAELIMQGASACRRIDPSLWTDVS